MTQSKFNESKHTVSCTECKNEIELTESNYEVGYIMECPFCGATLELVKVNDDKTLSFEIVEEEK